MLQRSIIIRALLYTNGSKLYKRRGFTGPIISNLVSDLISGDNKSWLEGAGKKWFELPVIFSSLITKLLSLRKLASANVRHEINNAALDNRAGFINLSFALYITRGRGAEIKEKEIGNESPRGEEGGGRERQKAVRWRKTCRF